MLSSFRPIRLAGGLDRGAAGQGLQPAGSGCIRGRILVDELESLGRRWRGWGHHVLAEVDHPLRAFAPAAFPVQTDAVVAFLSRALAAGTSSVSQPRQPSQSEIPRRGRVCVWRLCQWRCVGKSSSLAACADEPSEGSVALRAERARERKKEHTWVEQETGNEGAGDVTSGNRAAPPHT